MPDEVTRYICAPDVIDMLGTVLTVTKGPAIGGIRVYVDAFMESGTAAGLDDKGNVIRFLRLK